MLKWVCNNKMVTKSFLDEDGPVAKNKAFEAQSLTLSLLAMQWNVDIDILELVAVLMKNCLTRSSSGQSFPFWYLLLTLWDS